MRGATFQKRQCFKALNNFNPRSSCEERRGNVRMNTKWTQFQSTLLMRGATLQQSLIGLCRPFQSTLLMRGATSSTSILVALCVFQSTLLMRGATRLILLRRQPRRFQSTLLMRGATGLANDGFCHHSISIHAPHARSDDGNTSNHQVYKGISIHAPHARSDQIRVHWQS